MTMKRYIAHDGRGPDYEIWLDLPHIEKDPIRFIMVGIVPPYGLPCDDHAMFGFHDTEEGRSRMIYVQWHGHPARQGLEVYCFGGEG